MSSSRLADRIRANRKSRSPVEDTVEELYEEVSEAVEGGASYRKIHAQLTREGHNVGKGHSSLFRAFKKVKARRDQPTTNGKGSADPGWETVNGDVVPEPTQSSNSGLRAIVDTRRNTSGW